MRWVPEELAKGKNRQEREHHLMGSVPILKLNNGVEIPQLGFGVFQIPPAETEKAVVTALEVGYRSIDTASGYRNEEGVGAAIANAGVPRDELFVTTKLGNDDQGYDPTLRAFDASIGKLGLDFVDLYLIHWPQPDHDRYVDTWKAFEKLYADGRIRAIGVSNFQPPHLERLFNETDVVPAVNQIELHPQLVQATVRDFDAKHGIATEAWSPLAKGEVLGAKIITGLSQKYGKTPAQIVLRWHVQLGNVVIPKSVTPSRIHENFEIFDFELADDDVDAVSSLDSGTRTGPDPDTFHTA
jgi:diketogulonate reductase-like aldo/keto reductase